MRRAIMTTKVIATTRKVKEIMLAAVTKNEMVVEKRAIMEVVVIGPPTRKLLNA